MNSPPSPNTAYTAHILDEMPYKDYKESRRFQTTGYLKKRFDIILKKLFERIPNLQLRFRTRLFDYGQKLAMFARDKGKCFFCARKINFSAASFHHIRFYEKDNGPTTVENGAPSHFGCHTKYHAKHPDK